jgi:hypothetical protein
MIFFERNRGWIEAGLDSFKTISDLHFRRGKLENDHLDFVLNSYFLGNLYNINGISENNLEDLHRQQN